MVSRQELEEIDYQMGCATELQNAFARSRTEIQIHDDSPIINEFVERGKFVVASSFLVCCPSTDAYIGRTVYLEAIFDDEQSAIDYVNEKDQDFSELDMWVEPRPAYEPPQVDINIFMADDCPF